MRTGKGCKREKIPRYTWKDMTWKIRRPFPTVGWSLCNTKREKKVEIHNQKENFAFLVHLPPSAACSFLLLFWWRWWVLFHSHGTWGSHKKFKFWMKFSLMLSTYYFICMHTRNHLVLMMIALSSFLFTWYTIAKRFSVFLSVLCKVAS